MGQNGDFTMTINKKRADCAKDGSGLSRIPSRPICLCLSVVFSCPKNFLANLPATNGQCLSLAAPGPLLRPLCNTVHNTKHNSHFVLRYLDGGGFLARLGL